ncbi:16S rRNA (cytosine(967)-C(5))-methyltransferase RsmB, partial [Amphibiibacter pelophylacis]
MTPPPTAAAPLHELLTHTSLALAGVERGRSLSRELARTGAESPAARAGSLALASHALRHWPLLLSLRQHLLRRPPSPDLGALIAAALALLLPAGAVATGSQRPSYDAHTVVNEAVQAAKALARKPALVQPGASLVNAVLRRFLREQDALLAQALAKPESRHGHPAWWLKQLQRDWPQQWEDMAREGLAHPPFTLRAHAARLTPPQALQKLEQADLPARLNRDLALTLASAVPVQRLPSFDQGDLSVQDLAAQWGAWLTVCASPPLNGVGAVSDLPPGARILDACAAPGGKTLHLMELGEHLTPAGSPPWQITALDRDPQRLARIEDNLARSTAGAAPAAARPELILRCADAADTAAWWDGQPFDAILLDAPCSGSGVVRRHPDILALRHSSDIATLHDQQQRLLHALWPLLKPGGRLIYATCSVFRDEGEHSIRHFAQEWVRHQPSSAPITDLDGHPWLGHHV